MRSMLPENITCSDLYILRSVQLHGGKLLNLPDGIYAFAVSWAQQYSGVSSDAARLRID